MASRTLLIVATLITCWLSMQAVHELGHVIGALVTGGVVQRVVLHPLAISRTDVLPNPQPLIVVWAGPLLGCMLPLALWMLAGLTKLPGVFVVRFFAGFCLLANGLYVGVGSFDAVGDCGDLLRHGAQLWQLWLFGVIAGPSGLWLWDGQGRHFGLGRHAEPVQSNVAWSVALIAILIVGAEWLLSAV